MTLRQIFCRHDFLLHITANRLFQTCQHCQYEPGPGWTMGPTTDDIGQVHDVQTHAMKPNWSDLPAMPR